MVTYVMELKPGAPKGTFMQIKTLLNGFVPGWKWDKPRFAFSCEPELIPKMTRALQPLKDWVIGPYDQSKGPPVGTPIPFPSAASAPQGDAPETYTEAPPKPSDGAPTNAGAQEALPAYSKQLKAMIAAAGPPPAPPVPLGQPVQAADPNAAVPPPPPIGSSGLAPNMTSRQIPTKLPDGPTQVTMPAGFEPPVRAPMAVEPQTNGQPASDIGSGGIDGPDSATGGMLRGTLGMTDDEAMGNMRPFDYVKIAGMRNMRNKDGRHMIRVGPMSERVYCIRMVKDPTVHGSTWLIEKKYADYGGEQLLDRKPTWPEAVDVVLAFEMALADHLAPKPYVPAPAPVPVPLPAPVAAQPPVKTAPIAAQPAPPAPELVALQAPAGNTNGHGHEPENPPAPGVAAMGAAPGDGA